MGQFNPVTMQNVQMSQSPVEGSSGCVPDDPPPSDGHGYRSSGEQWFQIDSCFGIVYFKTVYF